MYALREIQLQASAGGAQVFAGACDVELRAPRQQRLNHRGAYAAADVAHEIGQA